VFGIRLGHGNLLYTAVAQDAPSHPHTDPRALFWVDLTTFINDAQATNSDIILMMDANADFQDAAFHQFLSDCSLTDLHSDNTSEPAPELTSEAPNVLTIFWGQQMFASPHPGLQSHVTLMA
jgi:hypothetical protein